MSSTRRTTPWHSFRLRERRSEREHLVGWLGGHPRGVRAHQWPRCRVCKNPMCHMGQFNAGPWLDLAGNARLSIFICHATGGRCEDWDPYKGANAVLIQSRRDDDLYDGPPTVRVYRRMRLTVEPPVDERALLRAAQERGNHRDRILAPLRHDKLGGGAVWLYGDGTPKTSDGRKMRLAVQLTTQLVAFDITERGMAYVFVRTGHEGGKDVATLTWQSGGHG